MSRTGATLLVSLLTDFGPGSVYVGQMHAVLRRRLPDVRIVDLAHDCPPGGIEAAAYVLKRSYGHFPSGSVHVVVVDPGVGTSRAVLAAKAHGHYFVGPDNGVLWDEIVGGEVRRVENRDWMAEEISNTFHGRDVMAPVAACLAEGRPLAEVGPGIEPLPVPGGPIAGRNAVEGRVLMIDRYGNCITNVPRHLVEKLADEGGEVRVRIGSAFIDGLVRTFADVAEGRALAYIGSGDHLEIAVNGGRATDLLHLGVADPVRVERLP